LGSNKRKHEPEDSPRPRKSISSPRFRAEYAFWKETNPKVAARLFRIIKETLKSPFTGIGKPEGLRHNLKGKWSRRLTSEDRIIYRVMDDAVEFLSARGHY
jgi:toxin YoeB